MRLQTWFRHLGLFAIGLPHVKAGIALSDLLSLEHLVTRSNQRCGNPVSRDSLMPEHTKACSSATPNKAFPAQKSPPGTFGHEELPCRTKHVGLGLGASLHPPHPAYEAQVPKSCHLAALHGLHTLHAPPAAHRAPWLPGKEAIDQLVSSQEDESEPLPLSLPPGINHIT